MVVSERKSLIRGGNFYEPTLQQLDMAASNDTVGDSKQPLPKTKKFVYVLTTFSAIGGFLFGYDTGVVSGAMILLKSHFALNSLWQELIVSVTVGFAAIFAFIGGPLNNAIGRRGVIITASIVFIAGSVLLAVSTSKEMLLGGRAVVGMGIGLASMTVPMYIAEVSPSHIRGRLVTVNNLMITCGQFIASCIDGLFSSDKVNGWRYMLGLAAVPAAIQFIGFMFLPESPRWLMQKDKYDKAKKTLQKILDNEMEVEREFQIIKSVVDEEKRNDSSSLCRVLSDVSVRRALFVGCGLQMFQQLSGINTVMYYSASIIQMSGVRDASLAIWLAAVTAFVNFLFTFVGVWLVERMGRRLLSLLSIGGVTLSLLFLSCGFFLSSLHSPPVIFNNTNFINTSNACSQFQSCAPCMQSLHCGYCYMEYHNHSVYNTSCLPIDPNNNQISTGGPCSSLSNKGPYFAPNYCPSPFSWMAMAGMIFYLAFFAPGMGPMPWTVNSEIYPQWARSTGNACSAGVNWIFNVIVSLTFLTITEALTTQGAFLLFACLALLGFFFIFLFLPETKGKPLEEIESTFSVGWLVPGRKESKAYHVILNNQQVDESDEDTLFAR
uniref:Proton myo-inositol cotransporter-like n=1 Tax=Phallusia mammillata TaxID=59560 RepID=A0A6F9DRY0_9ASCI|nr:proton myo-inositol cotransporter-like [Phallusia mammillata]